MTGTMPEVEAADAFVAGFGVAAQPPAIRRGNVVLVAGPRLAGTTGVLEALRERITGTDFAESDDLGHACAPVAVVFVVSAAARLTESDCALLDAAAAHTDLVVCAVSKVDLHRRWRETLDRNRALLAAHRPRYDGVPWVGVTASPDLGSPDGRRSRRHPAGAPGLSSAGFSKSSTGLGVSAGIHDRCS